LTFRIFSVTEQDGIVCFVRINAFHANIDVNDKNNCFGFNIKIYFKNVFVSFLLVTSKYMDTNCGFLITDVFLYSYEADFIHGLPMKNEKKRVLSCNFTFRYIDDNVFSLRKV
jgi:hypothetical protein